MGHLPDRLTLEQLDELRREAEQRRVEAEIEQEDVAEGDPLQWWAITVTDMSKGHRIVMQCTEADEPFFVLRAKDLISILALKEYEKFVEMYLAADPEMGESLALIIQGFQRWQRAHPAEVRLPD